MLYCQVLAVLAITLSGVWGATQWTASALGYQARLGPPRFELVDTPIYHPWRLFEWWFFFGADTPEVFNVGGSLLALVVAIGMAIWRARQARQVTTYGSALDRWIQSFNVAPTTQVPMLRLD